MATKRKPTKVAARTTGITLDKWIRTLVTAVGRGEITAKIAMQRLQRGQTVIDKVIQQTVRDLERLGV